MAWLVAHMWIALAGVGVLGILFGWSVRGGMLTGKIRRAMVERDISETELAQAKEEIERLYAAQRKAKEPGIPEGGDEELRAALRERTRELSDASETARRLGLELDELKTKMDKPVVGAAALGAALEMDDASLVWRNRHLESRVRHLESLLTKASEAAAAAKAAAVPAEMTEAVPAPEAASMAPEGEGVSEEQSQAFWRAEYLRNRVEALEDELAKTKAAPAEAPAASTDADEELARLRWRNRYLEGRVAYFEAEQPAGAAEEAAEAVETDLAGEEVIAEPVAEAVPLAEEAEPVAEPEPEAEAFVTEDGFVPEEELVTEEELPAPEMVIAPETVTETEVEAEAEPEAEPAEAAAPVEADVTDSADGAPEGPEWDDEAAAADLAPELSEEPESEPETVLEEEMVSGTEFVPDLSEETGENEPDMAGEFAGEDMELPEVPEVLDEAEAESDAEAEFVAGEEEGPEAGMAEEAPAFEDEAAEDELEATSDDAEQLAATSSDEEQHDATSGDMEQPAATGGDGPALVGVKPIALDKPVENQPDDLTQIGGIGPKIQELLNELGIWHYDQIGAWSPENIVWVDEHLNFSGRITREGWVEQANVLAGDEVDSTEDA